MKYTFLIIGAAALLLASCGTNEISMIRSANVSTTAPDHGAPFSLTIGRAEPHASRFTTVPPGTRPPDLVSSNKAIFMTILTNNLTAGQLVYYNGNNFSTLAFGGTNLVFTVVTATNISGGAIDQVQAQIQFAFSTNIATSLAAANPFSPKQGALQFLRSVITSPQQILLVGDSYSDKSFNSATHALATNLTAILGFSGRVGDCWENGYHAEFSGSYYSVPSRPECAQWYCLNYVSYASDTGVIGSSAPSNTINCYQSHQTGWTTNNLIDTVKIAWKAGPVGGVSPVEISWDRGTSLKTALYNLDAFSATETLRFTNITLSTFTTNTEIRCGSLNGTNRWRGFGFVNSTNPGVIVAAQAQGGTDLLAMQAEGTNILNLQGQWIGTNDMIYFAQDYGEVSTAGITNVEQITLLLTTNLTRVLENLGSRSRHIFIVSSPPSVPNNNADPYENEAYRRVCLAHTNWYYVDLYSRFPNYNENVANGMMNGVHPSDSLGMLAWAEDIAHEMGLPFTDYPVLQSTQKRLGSNVTATFSTTSSSAFDTAAKAIETAVTRSNVTILSVGDFLSTHNNNSFSPIDVLSTNWQEAFGNSGERGYGWAIINGATNFVSTPLWPLQLASPTMRSTDQGGGSAASNGVVQFVSNQGNHLGSPYPLSIVNRLGFVLLTSPLGGPIHFEAVWDRGGSIKDSNFVVNGVSSTTNLTFITIPIPSGSTNVEMYLGMMGGTNQLGPPIWDTPNPGFSLANYTSTGVGVGAQAGTNLNCYANFIGASKVVIFHTYVQDAVATDLITASNTVFMTMSNATAGGCIAGYIVGNIPANNGGNRTNKTELGNQVLKSVATAGGWLYIDLVPRFSSTNLNNNVGLWQNEGVVYSQQGAMDVGNEIARQINVVRVVQTDETYSKNVAVATGKQFKGSGAGLTNVPPSALTATSTISLPFLTPGAGALGKTQTLTIVNGVITGLQ